VLVGDIGNTLASVEPLRSSELKGIVFREVIGFSPGDPDAVVREVESELEAIGDSDTVRVSLAAHAPYSVAPRLFRAIRDGLSRRPFRPCSVHLAESSDELEFLRHGHGAWRALLEEIGAWDASWRPPGCGPLEYLERMGLLSERVLVVHGVHLTAVELTRLARTGATVVTCPRGNLATRAGVPPIEAFHHSGARVAIGTDSLASVDNLNLFEELAALRRLAPEVPAATLLAWATENGAQALGFADDYGAIEPGRHAALLAVALPAPVEDVEEYLLSGIDPAQVAWVETAH
jgi:cytosine/adenosine deaminase-related metal-dependent hydrolase